MDFFQSKFEALVDSNGRAFMTFHTLSRALGFYLDVISGFLVIAVVFISLAVRNEDNPLTLALAIQLVSQILAAFQFVTRLSSDIESYLSAVARSLEYTRLKSEPSLKYLPNKPSQ